ncbi:MAG: LysR family transcriptional regulator [Deltaproteobacteria bacterium]|nr:LysR family transcriptional regulator [Deltaproteobacteria bacterium]
MATPSWDDLRFLEALARTGDVGAATRELEVSVATLYRRIAALEASTGARCLTRTAGPTTLTDAGRELAEGGRRMREAFARTVGDVRRRDESLEGTVSLTTVEGMAPLLAPALRALRLEHPALRVDLLLSDRGPSVRRREVDVAISIVQRPPPDCWGTRLFRFDYAVFGTDAVLAHERPSWIVLTDANATTPEAKWERERAKPVAVATANRGAFLAFVREGVGLGLLPRPLAALYPELVEDTSRREGLRALDRVAWVLTHESHRKSPRIAALTQALVAHFRGR